MGIIVIQVPLNEKLNSTVGAEVAFSVSRNSSRIDVAEHGGEMRKCYEPQDYGKSETLDRRRPHIH